MLYSWRLVTNNATHVSRRWTDQLLCSRPIFRGRSLTSQSESLFTTVRCLVKVPDKKLFNSLSCSEYHELQQYLLTFNILCYGTGFIL